MISTSDDVNINTTDVTSGAETANPSGAPEFIPVFSEVRVSQINKNQIVVYIPLPYTLIETRLFSPHETHI